MAFKNLLGTRFGKLLVTERLKNKKDGTAIWKCVCDCGQIRTIAGTSLRAGRHKSCGCSSPLFSKERLTTHGLSRTRTYRIWAGMKQRCSDVAHGKSKRLYFDKGIRVCEKWQSFDGFFEDMGEAPQGCSIDRIDGNKGYELSNCKWSTPQEQGNNTSSNRLIEHQGKIQTVAQWAQDIGIKPNTLLYRIRRGWGVAAALMMPLQH